MIIAVARIRLVTESVSLAAADPITDGYAGDLYGVVTRLG